MNAALLVLLGSSLGAANALLPTPIRSFGAGGTGVVTATRSDMLFLNPARLGLEGSSVGIDGGDAREAGGWELSATMVARNPGKVVDNVLDHWSTLKQRNLDTVLVRDPEFFDALWDFNRQATGLRPELRADVHGGGYGLSLWGLADAGITERHGELYPSGTISDTLSVGVQAGTGQTLIRDELMVGMAFKSVWATSWRTDASSRQGLGRRDTIIDQAREEFGLENVEWVTGFDLGVLWLPVERIQLGTGLRDLGMWYRGDFLCPAWDVGAAWTPRGYQSEGDMPGHLSLAVSLNDLLNARQGWKFLSKVGMGADYSFSPLPWRALNFRLSVGALGGYPTAGIGLDALRALHLDMSTWAEESGWYTGQRPDRKWALKGALGW